MNEDSPIREIESKQVKEEEAMIDHLVRVFHRELTPQSGENESGATRLPSVSKKAVAAKI
jgi:hypothetical protein